MMSGGALLRRRRRHLRHRRAGHQGPVHEERRHRELPPVEPVLGRQRHAAAGDGRPVRRAGHRVRRRRVQGRARAQVQLRLRGVPRHRPRELPEGGLLEGGAARRPRAGAAEERLAVRRADPAPGRARARSSCSRAARSTTSPPSRRRSTTSRSACPAPRSSSTRTPARRARSAPRWRPCASSSARGHSTFIGLDAAIALEYTAKNDEETRLPLLPEQVQAHVHRHQDARRPHQPLHLRLLLREGHRRVQRGDARARRRAQEADEGSSRTWSTTRRSRRSGTSTTRRRCPRTARRSSDVEVEKALLRRQRRRPVHARRSSARRRRRWSSARRIAHRHPARAQHLLDRRRSSGRTSRRSASRSRTSSSPTTTTEEMWVEGGKYGSIDPCYPSKVAQAHIHNLLFHHHSRTRSKPLKYIFFPILTHVPIVRRRARWTTRRARSSPARRT